MLLFVAADSAARKGGVKLKKTTQKAGGSLDPAGLARAWCRGSIRRTCAGVYRGELNPESGCQLYRLQISKQGMQNCRFRPTRACERKLESRISTDLQKCTWPMGGPISRFFAQGSGTRHGAALPRPHAAPARNLLELLGQSRMGFAPQ